MNRQTGVKQMRPRLLAGSPQRLEAKQENVATGYFTTYDSLVNSF